MSIEIEKTMYVKRNEDKFLLSEVDGETVLMNIESGHYFGLNDISTAIWNKIGSGKKISQVVDDLLEEFDIDRTTCEQDTLQCITGMANMQLVLINN